MDGDMKLLYDSIITLTKELKYVKADFNKIIDDLNVKIAKLETEMSIVLDQKDKYNDLNSKINVIDTKVNELNSNKKNNRLFFQSVIVGIMVFIGISIIKCIN